MVAAPIGDEGEIFYRFILVQNEDLEINYSILTIT
jgi:hypothetical protein